MKYKWDKKIINHLEKNELVKQEIPGLFNPFYDLVNVLYDEDTPLKKRIRIDKEILDQQKYLKKYVKKVSVRYPEKIVLPIPSSSIDLSDDDLLDITHSFYKQFDKELYKSFLKIYKQRFTHLQVTNPTQIIGYPMMYYSIIADETFIKTINNSDINSITTLIHEYAHAISCNINDCPLYFTPFTEIESIFPQLAAFDYLDKTLKCPDLINFERAEEYNCALDYITTLYTKFLVTDKIKKNDEINRNLIKTIKQDLSLKEHELREIFTYDCESTNCYSLGYIVGFALYDIYQEDKEKAVFIYKHLLDKLSYALSMADYSKSYHKDSIRIIENHLDLGNNLDSFVRKIKRD